MSNFTAIFVDLPLDSLSLKCLKDDQADPNKRWWKIGNTSIQKRLGWDENNSVQFLFPDMNMYFTWYPLNIDLIELAREFLNHGKKIIFVCSQFLSGDEINYRSREEMGSYTINISYVSKGYMPILNGIVLDSDTFNIYTFIK